MDQSRSSKNRFILKRMLENLNGYQIILGSKSPRRKQLLQEIGLDFTVKTLEVEEVYPAEMPVREVPQYLSELKAKPFEATLGDKELVITSDTIVSIDNKVLGKPRDYEHAFEMIKLLSGRTHQVISGVCLLSKGQKRSFTSSTNVTFKALTNNEIDYYITKYKPYDKAGAYGIQEWIGHIGVEKIDGSYFNVMGLPVQRLYEELCEL